MGIFTLAFSLFLLIDPLGNIPFYLSVLKEIELKRQKKIIFRELFLALIIIVGFVFVGDALMDFLQIQMDALQITGGFILFLLSLKMIFPSMVQEEKYSGDTEPFLVPLAIPLVAGPGILAAVMIFVKQVSEWELLAAIILAWSASLLILMAAPSIKRLLGQKGILALERLMGLILILMAVQMALNGIHAFLKR